MSAEHSIETLSGRMFDFDAPTPDMIDINDVAVALSNTCRFGGHVKRYYSVAEHACLVYRLVRDAGFPPDVCFAALHHDSHEAYLGDVPTPLKRLLCASSPMWDRTVWRVDHVIRQAFGITVSFDHDAIKAADQLALGYEAAVLKPSGRAQCGSQNGHGAWVDVAETDLPSWLWLGWTQRGAQREFLSTHHEAVEAAGACSPVSA